MDHISQLIYAVGRGTPVAVAIEDCVVEVEQVVEKEVHYQINCIVEAGDLKHQYEKARRFCRFWNMMQAFVEKAKITRVELFEKVFGVHIREFEGYVKNAYLAYTLGPHQRRRA